MPTTSALAGPRKALDFSQPSTDRHPPRPAGTRAGARAPSTLPVTAVLQTTLELEPLLRLFSRELGAVVAHSGLSYRHPTEDTEVSVGHQARQACTYRLRVDGQDLGEIRFMRGSGFSGEELEAIEGLLAYLVYPMRNALRYREALRASLTDPLTGLYNRSFLENALRREVDLARRHRTPFSLIMVDIDRLKQINDRHGHRVGDAVIRALARSVAGCLRKTDLLARYGGDEFTLLLSNTDGRGARVLARHVAQRVDALRLQVEGLELKATVSLGVATLGREESGEALLGRADRALYRAKRRRTRRSGIRCAAGRR
jgi:diguanylate cyclase (GGDEF)-like protein